MKSLLKQIIENNKALDSCPRHSFDIDLMPERTMGKRWKCSKCGGELEGIHKHWYEIGLKHGGNNDGK